MVHLTKKVKNGEDFFNNQRKRNIRNTDKQYYNCAGYALNTFCWYSPVRRIVCHFSVTDLTEYINVMLEDFPDLRVIQNLTEVQEDEYAIAFRTSDRDFHYMKKGRDSKVWFSKQGQKNSIDRVSEKNVFKSEWNNGYYSKIVLFAKKL